MIPAQKVAHSLLFAGFVLCLLQVWLPGYYLTGDGPCHVYNAQIVHDLWSNKNTGFYNRFYSMVYQPNPNWFSTVVVALLLFVVNGVIAEKIFLTLYVTLYLSGFYLLLKKINGNTAYWMLIILLFVFPHTLSKGFYNFSFSVAFFFWVVWSWLCFLEKRTIANGLLFFLFTFLIFFTHLLAFGFGVFTCAALLLSYTIAAAKGTVKEKITGFFLKYAVSLCIFLAPFIILMVWFTQKEGGVQMQLRHHFYRLIEFAQFKYLVSVTHREDHFALAAGILLLAVFCIALVKRISSREMNKYDGFLLGLLFALFIYLFVPESFLGRLILITMRAQLFVFILMVCCIAYIIPQEKIKNVAGLILFGCFIGLSIVRIHCRQLASEGEADYLSACNYIKPYSVILPLDFDPEGKDAQGNKIANGCFLFAHASQYMGTEKPLIILDNYEANMGYFPLRWTDSTNPYYHLSKNEGIEGKPPSAGIAEYKQTSSVAIDYILMWCYNTSYLQDKHFSELYAEINAGYHIVYTSPTGRTLLFERNPCIMNKPF